MRQWNLLKCIKRKGEVVGYDPKTEPEIYVEEHFCLQLFRNTEIIELSETDTYLSQSRKFIETI